MPVLVYRQDDVTRESLRLPEDSELPGAQLVQSAAVGANPQVSPAVFMDRPHEVVRQPVFCREGREPAIPPPAQTASVCADPEIPLGVLAERKHHIVRQAVPGRIRGERPVFQARQPAAIRADPEAPVSRGEESHDIAVRERGGIGRVEDREADTVEPYNACLRREPQVAIGGLGNGLDRVLRQPVLHQPGGMGELREGLRGIEGERLGMPQRSQRDAGRDISYDLHQVKPSIRETRVSVLASLRQPTEPQHQPLPATGTPTSHFDPWPWEVRVLFGTPLPRPETG